MITRITINNSKGIILIDVLLAFSLSALFISIISESSHSARRIFETAKERKELIDLYENGEFSISSRLYGNNLMEDSISVSTSSHELNLTSIHMDENRSLTDFVGTPLCSVNFGSKTASITPIILPIDPNIPLTDMEIRNGIAYVSADSNVAADPDILIFDIRNRGSPVLLSSLNTGPGVRSISLAGNRIYAAAASTAYQLHVVRLNSLSTPVLEARYKVPLPEASSTPAIGSAIFYKSGKIYLGTEKSDGDEFNIIDVSIPLAPAKLGGLEIDSKITDIYVSFEDAYVSSAGIDQMMRIRVGDPANPQKLNSVSPSGWSRQEGKVISLFENNIILGRTSGGFNLINDHEIFSFASTSSSTLSVYDSQDIPGGVYGITSDRNNIYFTSSENNKEIQVITRFPFASSTTSYSLPVSPQMMTCDRDKLYVLGRTAPAIYEISFK